LVRKGYGPRSTLVDKLRLLTLPEDIQEKIVGGTDLSPAIGYELARLPDVKSQRALAEEIIAKGMSSRKVKEKVQCLNARGKLDGKEVPLQVEIPQGEIPGVFFKDSSDMSELPDDSVGLIVTSPPYGVGMEYEKGVSFEDHRKMLRKVLRECARVLRPGRRICINVGDIRNFGARNNGEPEILLVGHYFQKILRKHGVRLVDRIMWKKCHPGKKDFNWMSNPQVTYHQKVRHGTYRILDNTEYIFIFEKDGDANLPYGPEISKEEWKEWVDGVWEIPPVRGEKGHPAPFPDELVKRLIKMYSFEEEVVLDCFGGTMTTVKVARELDRVGVGYEKDDKYKSAIMKKLGVKEEDLKKPEKVHAGLTDEEEREAKKTLVNDILPAILADANIKGERIAGLIVPVKRNLSKKEIKIETVPVDDDRPPTSPLIFPGEGKPDDYTEKDKTFEAASGVLAKAA
jgi:DNA modification methylase